MPEIAIRFCEFDRDPPSAPTVRIHRHYAALALFLGEAIDDEDLLSGFYAGLHAEQAAIQAHCHRCGFIAERAVPGGPSVNFDGNRKREAIATATFDHWDPLRKARN